MDTNEEQFVDPDNVEWNPKDTYLIPKGDFLVQIIQARGRFGKKDVCVVLKIQSAGNRDHDEARGHFIEDFWLFGPDRIKAYAVRPETFGRIVGMEVPAVSATEQELDIWSKTIVGKRFIVDIEHEGFDGNYRAKVGKNFRKYITRLTSVDSTSAPIATPSSTKEMSTSAPVPEAPLPSSRKKLTKDAVAVAHIYMDSAERVERLTKESQ